MKKTIFAWFTATIALSLVLVPMLANANNLGVGLGLGSSLSANKNKEDKNISATGTLKANSKTNAVASTSDKNKKAEKDERDDNENDSGKVRKYSNATSSATTSLTNLPPGIQHAPGIQKRLEEGKGLPPGLLERVFNFFFHRGGQSTTTPKSDIVIKDIRVVEGATTATIMWSTNLQTSAQVLFGSTTPITASSTSVSNISLTYNHELALSGLSPDTTYFYKIVATDASANVKSSQVLSFKTKTIDAIAPVIVFVTNTSLTSSGTRIIWVTDELSDSRVWVSTTMPVLTSATSTQSSSALSFYHDLQVNGLASSTQYFYAVASADASDNRSVVTGNTFTTLAP